MMAAVPHRTYALDDEDDVARLGSEYRRVLHGRRPDKLAVQDKHIERWKDSAHVNNITLAYRKIAGYSHFDCRARVPEHNTARLVLDYDPKQMLSSLGEDIDRTNWAGWTCLHMAAWYGCLPHVEALLDAEPRAASALRPSAQDFTLAAGCTAVDVAKYAIRKFVHKSSAISTASQGWADREAILWRLNEAAMVEWIALVSPNASTAYRQAFTSAVRALWLALGGKHLGPPIRREGYKGSATLGFDSAVRLLGGGERAKKISLPDCYRIWAESAATEAQGHLLGGQLRGLLYAMLPPCAKLWVYARTAEAVTEDSLRAAFGEFAQDASSLQVVSLGLLAHDDPVGGTGSAALASSPEAVAQAADGSSTRPLGWDCCALLEFKTYAEAATAFEAQRKRTRGANDAPQVVTDREEGSKDKLEGAQSSAASETPGKGVREQTLDSLDELEPGELEPGEIRPPGPAGEKEHAEPADAKPSAGPDEMHHASSEDGDKEVALYLVEWSRLGPLRLPPMPRTAALTKHFGVMPPDFHFTSLGL